MQMRLRASRPPSMVRPFEMVSVGVWAASSAIRASRPYVNGEHLTGDGAVTVRRRSIVSVLCDRPPGSCNDEVARDDRARLPEASVVLTGHVEVTR